MQWPAPAPHSPLVLPAAQGALPPLPELAARLAAAAGRSEPEPVGGALALRRAAADYWARRGLPTAPDQVLAGPGAQPLLLTLLALMGGDVLLTRPSAAWYAPLARLADRPTYHAPAPAECGGVPDPFALLETVRRIRKEGGAPRVLLLAVADDPTGTVAPPELLHEVCEAAEAEDLLIVSDETWRDTVHTTPGVQPLPPERAGTAPADPAERERQQTQTVLVSPAEMVPDRVVVLTDLAGALMPPSWPAAITRFPACERGRVLRARLLAALSAVRAELPAPVAAAAQHALTEPAAVRARMAAAARAYGVVGTAAYQGLTDLGVLCRPPRAGRHLYADVEELRGPLADRGIADSVDLERHLTRRLGYPVPGGYQFGDAPDTLRIRLPTLPLLGADDEQRLAALAAAAPLELPHGTAALTLFMAAFNELTGGAEASPEAPGS
ncbi:aminotransferase class I/II-fold pyridoxal phosphate-dependent enzyme [Streptomyces zagrosensis]|uniref:Aspartate/methionine/tyrosine aminotransferase n=1 Tax=Streptomyces zagrosensis TaxID=1042984 RepID=A0A7W9QC11_9ACTN|nr:aminotransferase class I/II-fold pyridoxal phosphate-dependent enzyme [Streptomyces zagrosensis]MBB5937384.1 aspartate/methionine/tyrosine aminotransferase [Streptomyces zagrosensis]